MVLYVSRSCAFGEQSPQRQRDFLHCITGDVFICSSIASVSRKEPIGPTVPW